LCENEDTESADYLQVIQGIPTKYPQMIEKHGIISGCRAAGRSQPLERQPRQAGAAIWNDLCLSVEDFEPATDANEDGVGEIALRG
jgi:hypothetical protein